MSVDYQLAVTTTSAQATACSGSVACGGDLVRDAILNTHLLTPSSPSLAAAFARMVSVGTSGAGIEQPLAAAVLALTPPKLSTVNAGLVRSDAALAVVVVSDASDQSTQPVSYYLNRLMNLKGPNRFTFSVVGQ
jgi:hypothetical protein